MLSHVKIHDVVNVMHTTPYFEQQYEMFAPISQRPDPVPAEEGIEFVVDKISRHRKRGRGYQLLTILKGDPTHEAE